MMRTLRGGTALAFAAFAALVVVDGATGLSPNRLGFAVQAGLQPTPGSFAGHGSRVLSVRIPRSSPVVVAATHTGSSNFVVRIVGPGGSELLVNEIGRYNGDVAFADAKKGRYRIAVEADGNWTVRVTQPVPSTRDRRVPGAFSGRGSHVIKVRSTRDLQPVVTASHRGQSNFIVYLIGYGSVSGNELLFNEIGKYKGQTLVDDLPKGSYLLAVQADGSWSIKLTR